jgi:hypothetical protein
MTIQTQQVLFSNISLPASGSIYSVPVNVAALAGPCSLFVQSHDASPTADTGTISITYELSNDKLNWSQDWADVLTAFTKTSGPASDGKTFLEFTPTTAFWLRLKVTETGTVDIAYVTVIIGIT